jgi:acetyl-CoA C-acetyltransferase
MSRAVYIVSAVRTPIGSFQGGLADVPATRLGAHAIEAAVDRSGLAATEIGEVYMGNVLSAGLGQAPARQAAKLAGLPDHVPATTVGKVCGSGLQSAILGAKSILLGDAETVVAGGMESMSNAPYLLPKARSGYRMGHGQVQDSMILDGLWDPYKDWHMGNAGELCAREYQFSREEQDAFAIASYERALAAQEAGEWAGEVVPVVKKGRKGEVTIAEDEDPKAVNFDKMVKLRPAFDREAGTITAANAPSVNDGASALVLASEDVVNARGLTPLARVVAYGGHAQAPEWFTTAPIEASRRVLEKAGWSVGDVDFWEVNEAFSVVAMAHMKAHGIDHGKMNVRGGSVALGHPIGASGARILTTLLHVMKDKGGKKGVASICLGGGEAVALGVEAV